MSSTVDELRVYQEIKQRLLADDPELDQKTLHDTLEGCTELHERIAWLCRSAHEAEVWAYAVGIMIKDMAARKKRHETRSEHLRGIALWALQEAGIPKITAPDLTVSVGKTRPSVVISDLTAIPPHLVTYEPKADKHSIRIDLEAGIPVPGASLSNAVPTLTIRTK